MPGGGVGGFFTKDRPGLTAGYVAVMYSVLVGGLPWLNRLIELDAGEKMPASWLLPFVLIFAAAYGFALPTAKALIDLQAFLRGYEESTLEAHLVECTFVGRGGVRDVIWGRRSLSLNLFGLPVVVAAPIVFLSFLRFWDGGWFSLLFAVGAGWLFSTRRALLPAVTAMVRYILSDRTDHQSLERAAEIVLAVVTSNAAAESFESA